jgi:hypothetical protein
MRVKRLLKVRKDVILFKTFTDVIFFVQVRKCCASSDFMVRTMSARALVALVPSKSFCQFLSNELIDFLPTSSQSFYSHNQLHGLLLQIQILLRGTQVFLTQFQCRE